MEIKVPDHITDKEEIAAWIADQEEQAAMNAKMKAEAAAKNEAVAPIEAAEEVAVEDTVEVEVKPAPVKKATRSRKKK